MRKVKLLILLSFISLQFTIFVAAQGPKHPDIKRRGRESAPADKPRKWERTKDARLVEPKTVEERSKDRDRRTSGRRNVEKASRWEKHPQSESRSGQQEKLREHVFRGWINGRGRPVGFHYEGAGGRPADGIKVIEGSRSTPDANGVYKAEIEAGGIKKGYHTFFPRSWSRADVERAINEAYVNRVRVGKASNGFKGKSSSGLTVGMKCNKDGVLKTAYPIYAP